MADIILDFGFKDLEKANKVLQELKKAANDLRKTIQGTGAALDGDAAKAKKLASSAKLVAAEKKKLNTVDREQIKIARQLDTINAKLALANSKEARTLAAKKKQLQDVNRQLRTGGQNTNTWGKALGSFQFKFNALGNIASNVVSQLSRKLAQFVKGSLEAYDKQIKAEQSLFVAMGRRADATDRLIRQAARLQKITLFGDEETIKAQALIAAFVKEEAQIRKIIPLVQDFAQAKSMDLAGAADLVAKTLGSSTNAMSRYGIQVEGAVGSTERLESLARGLSDAFGGQAEAAALVDANFTQLKNTMGDLQEKIGEFITDSIFMLRVQSGLLGKSKEDWTTASVSVGIAVRKFLEFKNEITDSKSAILALNKIREESDLLKKEYKEAVSVAANAKRKEFTAANEVVKSKKEEKAVYAELIPMLEIYIDQLTKSETVTKKDTTAKEDSAKAEDNQSKASDKHSESMNKSGGSFNRARREVKAWWEEVVTAQSVAEDFFEKMEEKGADVGQKSKLGDILPELNLSELDRLKENTQQLYDDGVISYQTYQESMTGIAKAQEGERAKLAADTMEIAKLAVTSFSNLYAAQKEKELSMVGDNAKKREAIERKYAKKEQNLAVISAIIDTAQGIAKVIGDYGLPWGLIPAAAVAALGGLQISTIKSQTFGEGGDIEGPSHSRGGVNVEVEGGEYVINKRSTSKYKDLIKAINDDDQVRIMDAMARDRKIEITRGADPYTRKMFELMQKQEIYGEDNEFYYKHKGNMVLKIRKN